MTRFSSYLTAVLIATAPLAALAQQGSGTGGGPTDGYGPMWRDGWGWSHGMMFGPLMMVLMFLILAFLVVMAFRYSGRGPGHPWDTQGHRRRGDALDILEQRFARGEIDQSEFETKRTLLSR